jgi:hypothetical protein
MHGKLPAGQRNGLGKLLDPGNQTVITAHLELRTAPARALEMTRMDSNYAFERGAEREGQLRGIQGVTPVADQLAGSENRQ